MFVENDDSDENIVRKSINEGGVSPPDEPFAPDGSRSVTPELTNLPEGTVPRNCTTPIDRKKLASNEVRVRARVGNNWLRVDYRFLSSISNGY